MKCLAQLRSTIRVANRPAVQHAFQLPGVTRVQLRSGQRLVKAQQQEVCAAAVLRQDAFMIVVQHMLAAWLPQILQAAGQPGRNSSGGQKNSECSRCQPHALEEIRSSTAPLLTAWFCHKLCITSTAVLIAHPPATLACVRCCHA